MSTSLIYRSSSLYELAMVALYGRHYTSRYRAIAELIPAGSSVLDVCCGPSILYHRYLKTTGAQYVGLDINAKFIAQLISRGGNGQVWDLRTERALPPADYVIMQASLYHFLPDASQVVNRMLDAARERVVIAEPIRNLATSDSRVLSTLGRFFTNPGVGEHSLRFTESSLADFFSSYSSRLIQSFPIAGGREQVYVLDASVLPAEVDHTE